MEITLEELGAQRWDYVALGPYPVHRPVAENAFYSGSLDYTSTNPWGELIEERESGNGGEGIHQDHLAHKTHKIHAVPPEGRWGDLAPLSGAGRSPPTPREALREELANCEG